MNSGIDDLITLTRDQEHQIKMMQGVLKQAKGALNYISMTITRGRLCSIGDCHVYNTTIGKDSVDALQEIVKAIDEVA